MYLISKSLIVAIVLSALYAGPCFADWTGGIEAGARLGSDERPTLRFYANKQATPLSHYGYLDWIRSSGGSNYRIGYEPTFNISHSFYTFGRFSIEQDDPGAVEREIDAVIGVGNNLFQRGNTRVKVEAGVGGRKLTFSESDQTTTDSTEGFGFLSSTMTTSLLSLLRFDASIQTKAGSEQRSLDGEAGISIPIGPGTSLRYVYNVKRYKLDGRDDINSEDSFFKVTYGF